jgi:hypothetical protein
VDAIGVISDAGSVVLRAAKRPEVTGPAATTEAKDKADSG